MAKSCTQGLKMVSCDTNEAVLKEFDGCSFTHSSNLARSKFKHAFSICVEVIVWSHLLMMTKHSRETKIPLLKGKSM